MFVAANLSWSSVATKISIPLHSVRSLGEFRFPPAATRHDREQAGRSSIRIMDGLQSLKSYTNVDQCSERSSSF